MVSVSRRCEDATKATPPSQLLLGYAIVVGTRATPGLERLFLGSTADGVIRRARMPTFVIPPTATAVLG